MLASRLCCTGVTDCKLKQSMKMSQLILGTSLICEHLYTVSHAALAQWLAAHSALGTDFLPSASQKQQGKMLVWKDCSSKARIRFWICDISYFQDNRLWEVQRWPLSSESVIELNEGKELSSTNSSTVTKEFGLVSDSFFCSLISSYSSMPLLLFVCPQEITSIEWLYVPRAVCSQFLCS